MTAPREQERGNVLETIDRIIERGGDADDILREVVGALGPLYDSVAVAFVEDGALVVGPTAAKRPDPSASVAAVPITFEGAPVGELQVAPAHDDDGPFLERVAHRVSPYCLVGWDTGGVPWEAL
jgi:hypothetical protein